MTREEMIEMIDEKIITLTSPAICSDSMKLAITWRKTFEYAKNSLKALNEIEKLLKITNFEVGSIGDILKNNILEIIEKVSEE